MVELTNVGKAAIAIKKHTKDYIDISSIILGHDSIRVRVIDHNNPYMVDDYQTERIAKIIEKITDFRMVRQGSSGEILMNYKGENDGQ